MSANTDPTFTLTTSSSSGDFSTGTCTTPWVTYTPSTWVYSYPYYGVDKTRQAFQIIQTLEKKGHIKLKSVKQFMSLVDEIYKIL